jgi:hypothetical protein
MGNFLYSYPEKFFPVILGGDLETIALPTGGLSQRPLKVGSGLGDFSFYFHPPIPKPTGRKACPGENFSGDLYIQ